jgi:serine/threonine-protein kinase
VKILDRELLVRKDKVVPGKPDESPLLDRITADDESRMPPPGQPRLGAEEVDAIRRWIAEGAKPFPEDAAKPAESAKDPSLAKLVGVDYVLKSILKDIRSLQAEDKPFVRYFSANHLLTGGATEDELDLQREALAKAINHLTWERDAVRPDLIEPSKTVFRVDLRALGWDKRPLELVRDGKAAGQGRLNLFDLVLLEYPYGVIYESSETFDALGDEFLLRADQVRPIPYVRADWFVSTATQPPLYEDMLLLPSRLEDLESRLGVDSAADLANGKAKRAGMAVSGVSRNNRVVERHAFAHGAYWKSFDFKSSKGRENIFKDPVNLNPAGGEMIFNLPNGLQGYLLANAAGVRLDAAPTEIVTDKFAEDKTVRNGLACMRCHDAGMKDFADTVGPAVEVSRGSPGFDRRTALRLYARKAEMDALLEADTKRFRDGMARVLGKPQAREPLIPASRRFLEAPLQLTVAGAELGLAEPAELQQVFRSRSFTSLGLAPLASFGAVRRDMWEDYYDRIVRQLGLGFPVVPIDALTRPDFQSDSASFDATLATNKKTNVFAPSDELVIRVGNPSRVDLHIELVGTSALGRKVILAPATTLVKAGGEYRFPPQGAIKVRGGVGKEKITLIASDVEFPPGELFRGKDVVDRVVHRLDLKQAATKGLDPARVIKKTIEIETR